MDFTVEFYETGTGKCPVREFLDELKASDPDDHIFDLHVEGGFVDDMEIIRETWASIRASEMTC